MTIQYPHIQSNRGKFTEFVIFYRILVLGATLAYALSFSADVFLGLRFSAFIIPSIVIAFLFFSVFILSFFVDTINRYFNLLARVMLVAVHFHLVGLIVVNHFRPELLFGLIAATFLASFIFRKLKGLILFDLVVIGIMVIAIFIDRYVTHELEVLKVPVIRPYIDPVFFLLSEAGIMILAALFSTIRFVQFRNLSDGGTKRDNFIPADGPQLLVNSISGTIFDCNDLAVQLFQYPDKQSLTGLPLDALLKESYSGDYFSQFRNSLFRNAKADAVVTLVSRGGKFFTGILSARQGADQLIRFTVSEPVVMELESPVAEELHEVRERSAQKSYLDQFVIPVASILPDYRFGDFNQAFCELTGYTADELKRMKYIHLLHPEDQAREKQFLSNLFSGKIPLNRSEKRLIKRSSRQVWISASSSLIRDENGFPLYVTSVLENISQKKRFEKLLIHDKANLSSVIDHADLYAVNINRNHAILFLNEKLKEVLFDLTETVVETGFNLRGIIPDAFSQIL